MVVEVGRTANCFFVGTAELHISRYFHYRSSAMTHNVCSNNAAVFGAQNDAHGAAIKRPILWRRSAHTKPHQKPLSDHNYFFA
jgi:hypothetical protein